LPARIQAFVSFEEPVLLMISSRFSGGATEVPRHRVVFEEQGITHRYALSWHCACESSLQ